MTAKKEKIIGQWEGKHISYAQKLLPHFLKALSLRKTSINQKYKLTLSIIEDDVK